MFKRTGLMTSCGLMVAGALLLPSLQAQAETRLSYGIGGSYCSSDFESCDGAAVITVGLEHSLNEASSVELSLLGGGMLFSGDYMSSALHYKYKLSPHKRSSFFVAAGPHYYQIDDNPLFGETNTRSGFGVSTKVGWQRYQRTGFGLDLSAFAKTMPGSDVTAGFTISASYAFDL